MGLRSLGVCVVLILCAELHYTNAATVTVTTTLGVKGVSGHRVTCQFGFAAGETLRQLNIYRGSSSATATVFIATMLSSDTAPLWGVGADDTLKARANLSGSPGQQSVAVEFNNTICDDKDKVYRCELSFRDTTSYVRTTENYGTVQIEAPPKSPSPMTVRIGNPLVAFINDSVPEFTLLTFTCEGNVGFPAGTFQWFTYFGSTGSTPTNVTDQAVMSSPTTDVTDSCTFKRSSTLIYNTTRTQVGRRLIVKCRAFHQTQGSNTRPVDCGSNETFCRMSQTISVQYPVSVSVSPPSSNLVQGQSATFTCNLDSNPVAYGTLWYQEIITDVLSNTTTLRLTNITLNQGGVYTCISFNKVGDIIYNSTATARLTVSPTTPPTSPTTRTTIPSQTSPGGGGGSTVFPGVDGSATDSPPIAAAVGGAIAAAAVVTVAVAGVKIVYTRRKQGCAKASPTSNRTQAANGNSRSTELRELSDNTVMGRQPPSSEYEDLRQSEVGLASTYSPLHQSRNTGLTQDRGDSVQISHYEHLQAGEIGLRSPYSAFSPRGSDKQV